VNVGDTWDLGGYEFTLEDVRQERGPNYFTTMADIRLAKNGTELALMNPEKRNYPVAQMPTTEAAIDYNMMRDVYVVIGDPQADGGWAVRTYIKPMANWIWLGSALMALGGLISLTDRRFRIAAGARKQTTIGGVPAE